MGAPPHDVRLGVLTRLGHRLVRSPNAEAAALEVVRGLAPLELASCVAAVEGNDCVVLSVHVPTQAGSHVSQAAAARLVGTRLPLDGAQPLARAVRQRRPYVGAATPPQMDAGTVADMPWAVDGTIAVPVLARSRVRAVLCAWGAGCSPELTTTLEAAAAMLAASWNGEKQRPGGRFSTPSAPSRSTQLRSALRGLIAGQSMVAAVQPIVRLYDHSVIGYEALSRFPPSTHFTTPDGLFSAASSLHMEAALDLACVRAAVREAPNIGDVDLFVNVLTGTLLEQRGMTALHQAVHDSGVDPSSIVLEFSERDPVPDLAQLQRIAEDLRTHGYRIAVDDAGAGHASMRVIAELRPDFIKVDRSLIHAVDSDRPRRALVVSLLSFGGHIGARLIAEGIETKAEHDTLLTLGVQFGQGWLLGRPVLSQPVEGVQGVEVVDSAWFAQRPLSPIRLAAPVALRPAAQPGGSDAGERAPTVRGGLARALSNAALALQSEHDPLRILGVMADQMRRVVPVREMAIYAADYETHRFLPVLARGEDRDEIMADSFSLDAGITGAAFARGIPENIADTSAHPLARQVPGTPVVHESLLLIPLIAGEHKLGIINCWRQGTGRFSEGDREAASLFAHIAAAAWRNAQLYSELLSAAMTDPLTGLYNSRWLRDTAERDLVRSTRDGKPLTLLLVDLDHFKMVNDSIGHAAGDLVLQRVASRLRGIVRGADAVVRLGGEEFVVLLHDCNGAGGERVAESVRVSVRDISLPEECGLRRLTASVGIAVHPDHGVGLDQLLAAADRAMYAAKHGGRDRVVHASSAESAGVVPLPRWHRDSPQRGEVSAGS